MESDLGIVEIGQALTHEVNVAYDPCVTHTTSTSAHLEIEEVCAEEFGAHAQSCSIMWKSATTLVPALACEAAEAEVTPPSDDQISGLGYEWHPHARRVDGGKWERERHRERSPCERHEGNMDSDEVSTRLKKHRSHGLGPNHRGETCGSAESACSLHRGWDMVGLGEQMGSIERDHGVIVDGEVDAHDEDGEEEDAAIATLLIGELTENWMQEAYLDSIFTQLGERPVSCRVARDWQDGGRPSMGYAMVQLRSARAAHKLMAAFDSALPAMHPYRFVLRPAKSPCSVYVGSLDMPWLSSPVLRFIFAEEAIANTHLPHDESGAHRGYGFVSFTTAAVAQRVIKTYHDAPLGRGRVHSMRWADANLVAASVARPSASSADASAEIEGSVFESTRSAMHVDYVSARLTTLPGSAMPSSMAPFLGNQRSVAFPRDEPPSALLARAQELHLQARSKTVHTAKSRLEMASRAQRLLDGLISTLSPPADSPYRLRPVVHGNDFDS